MRTQEKFNSAYKAAEWYTRFHNKGIWLVPTDEDYQLDLFKPKEADLPAGTAAILYDVDMQSVSEVRSSKPLL